MKDDRLYLLHIRESIERIQAYTSEGRDAFLADLRTQDAVLRNLHTLAESTQRLSDELKEDHPSVSWQAIAGFRNVLVHDYLGISLSRVWEVLSEYLPELRDEIELMLASLES